MTNHHTTTPDRDSAQRIGESGLMFDTAEGWQAFLDAPAHTGSAFGAGRGMLRDLDATTFADVVGAGEAARASAYITQMRHSTFVGKHFVCAANERGWKTANPGNFYDGTAVVHSVPTSADLLALFNALGVNDAVTIGRPSNGATQAHVVTKYQAQLAQDAGKVDVIARSKDHFQFPAGVAGWLLLDVDPKSMPPAARAVVESNGGLLESIFAIWPELRGYDYLAVPSSSAGVAAAGRLPDSLYAMHVYVLLPDLSKAQAVANNLLARCWESGLAWWMISASGARLERGLIDVSVASPERLAFEAQPKLDAGLVRHSFPPVVNAGSIAQLPQPPASERWADDRSDAWHAAEAAADAAKLQHRTNYIANAVARFGISEAIAGAMYDRTMDGTALGDDFLLPWHDGGYQRVGDVLDNLEADRAAGRDIAITLPDPLEGHSYHHAAQLRWGSGYASPVIHSRAHGQDAQFVFERYSVVAPAAPDTSADGVAPNVAGKHSPEWQAGRRAKVDKAAAHLRFIVENWLAPIVEGGAVSIDVAAADARADAEAEEQEIAAGGFDDPKDAQRLKDRLRRQGRKEVQRKHNLGETPTSKHRLAAGGFVEGHGTIATNLLISGAQGIGKTSTLHGNDADDTRPAAAGLAHTVIGANVFYAQPDTAKAEESFNLYQRQATEDSPVAIHLRGRDSDDPEIPGSKMCLEPEMVETLQVLGESIRAACNVCPSRDLCSYMKQTQKVEDAKAKGRGLAVFADNSYLHTGLPVDIQLHGIVADEIQRDLGVEALTIPVQRLKDLPFPEPKRKKDETNDSFAQRFNAASAEWQEKVVTVLNKLQMVLTSAPDARDVGAWILPAAEKHGLTVTALMECAALVAQRRRNEKLAEAVSDAAQKARHSGSGAFSGDVASALGKLPAAYPHAAVAALLRDLAKELAARGGAVASGLPPKQNFAALRWANARRHMLQLTTRKPQAYKGVPMLHLDGTGKAIVSSLVFDREFGEESVAAPRNAVFSLVGGRKFSQRALLPSKVEEGKQPTAEQDRKSRDAKRLRGDLLDLLPRWAESVGADPAKLVTLTSKKMCGTVELDGADFCGPSAHYANLRGNDSFKNCDAAALIGNPLPPAESIDAIAVAFSTGLQRDFVPSVGGYVKTEQPVTAQDGTSAVFDVFSMADPLAQLVFEQTVYAEMMQAVDRPRLMFCPAPKPVLLATGILPAGIEIDHIIDWSDLKDAGMYEIKCLKALGFIPLSPSALARVSGILVTGDCGDSNTLSPKSPVTELTELTQDQARTVTPRAKELTNLIGMPQRMAAMGLPALATWFSLSIRLGVPEGEGIFRTFNALGVAGSAEEMQAKVHAAFAGTGYSVRELTVTEQPRDPATVVAANRPAVTPDMRLIGEACEYVMHRDCLPDHLRIAQRLASQELVNIRTVAGTADSRRHYVYLLDHDFCDATGETVDRLSVAFVTDLHGDELAAYRAAKLHEHLTAYRPRLPALDTYAETTTRKTFVGAFATLAEAEAAAQQWESFVDAIDGEIATPAQSATSLQEAVTPEPSAIDAQEIARLAAEAAAAAVIAAAPIVPVVLATEPAVLTPEIVQRNTGMTGAELGELQGRWGLSLEEIDRLDIERREFEESLAVDVC